MISGRYLIVGFWGPYQGIQGFHKMILSIIVVIPCGSRAPKHEVCMRNLIMILGIHFIFGHSYP